MSVTQNIYKDIAKRTGGTIIIGVVGPVRTGKSTFIKRFMEQLVLPNISDPFERERAKDEMPQTAAGKTVMTTEPKFVPENAVRVNLGDGAVMNVKLADCVGYVVPEALGTMENGQSRMVLTPWSSEPMSFETLCFSMYSDMSSLIMALSSPNITFASAFVSSVFPTPVGPRKINEPMGRLGSLSPILPRLIARATASTALS